MRNPTLTQVPSTASAGIYPGLCGSWAQALTALTVTISFRNAPCLPPPLRRAAGMSLHTQDRVEHLLRTGLSPTCAPGARGPGFSPYPPPPPPPALCRSRAGRGAYQRYSKDFPLPSLDTSAPLPYRAPLHSHPRGASFTFRVDGGSETASCSPEKTSEEADLRLSLRRRSSEFSSQSATRWSEGFGTTFPIDLPPKSLFWHFRVLES